jgi:hypothetical protein
MTQEIVETCYPLYDGDMEALIAKVYAAYKGKADVDDRLIDVIWQENHSEFRTWNIEASQRDTEAFAAAQRGVLTAAGRAVILAYIDEAQDYVEQLRKLSDAELAAKYDEVCGPSEAEVQAKRHERGQQADLMAFFSRPSAIADYAHWCSLPVWSAEEATALSVGKDPRRVNTLSLRRYTFVCGSPFRDEFLARLDKIERALRSKQIREPLRPINFVKWAISHGLELPPDLVAGIPLTIRSRPELDIREVHTFYKVVLGLAIKHYKYDPTLEDGHDQDGVFGSMRDDLHDVEASTSIPTLQKMLKLARAWAIIKPQPLVKRVRREKEKVSKASSRV